MVFLGDVLPYCCRSDVRRKPTALPWIYRLLSWLYNGSTSKELGGLRDSANAPFPRRRSNRR